MKRMSFFMAIMASLTTLASCEKNDEFLTLELLPQAAQQCIETHFGDLAISSVVKDYDEFTYSYDVYFTNGNKIEFNRSGEWTDIDCRYTKVPDSIVPAGILSYVNANYPSNDIDQISVDRRYYEVDLDNGVDLVFTKSGDFVRVDDDGDNFFLAD